MLAPDQEEKLKLEVAVAEGCSGGNVHDAGAGQGEPAARECEEEEEEE